MDRYQKVEKPKSGLPINENEIRITAQGLVRNYLSYATTLLQERHGKEIVIKAMGQAISKTVTIAEVLKRRIPQLHQDIAISSVSIVDVYEPIEEGLLPVETSRQVSMISITLSAKELNKNSPGYQAPSYAEQSRPQENYQHQKPQQRPRQALPFSIVGTEDSYGRGRGQGRGRGRGRGWSRGGYDNYEGTYQRNYQGGYQGNYQRNYQGGYQGNYQGGYQGNYQENGYSNWSRGGGRGPRGTGYSYRGTGHGRSRGRGGGRGYGSSVGRMDGYLRDGYNQD